MEEKEFVIFWRNGKKQTIRGNTIANAFLNAGYGAGAIRDVDFYGDKTCEDKYYWNKSDKEWEQKVLE